MQLSFCNLHSAVVYPWSELILYEDEKIGCVSRFNDFISRFSRATKPRPQKLGNFVDRLTSPLASSNDRQPSHCWTERLGQVNSVGDTTDVRFCRFSEVIFVAALKFSFVMSTNGTGFLKVRENW